MAYKGSGSTFIQGFLKDKMKENLSFFEVRDLAIKALALAMDVDGSSGGNIRLNDVKSTG